MGTLMRVNDRWMSVAAIAALLVALSGCDRKGGQVDSTPMFVDDHGSLVVPAASPMRSHLTVQEVGQKPGASTLDLPAAIEADPAHVAAVLSPLTGRILALKIGLGDHVRHGQILAIVQSGDFAQARSDLDKSRDALALAQKAVDRARGVLEVGGAANKDLEAAQSAYVQAQAEQKRAQARLVALNQDVKDPSANLVLRAPQTGTVTTLAAAAGAQVNDPTAVLMTVTNLDRVFVTANVAEQDVGRVRVGSDATVVLVADPSHPFQAKISEVNATLDPDTRRQKVRISLSNAAGRLLPNMYATVRLAGPPDAGVVVPQTALLMNNDAISVLVETRPWVFQRRLVRIGDETDASVQVLSGLKSGDRVIVRGGVLLDD